MNTHIDTQALIQSVITTIDDVVVVTKLDTQEQVIVYPNQMYSDILGISQSNMNIFPWRRAVVYTQALQLKILKTIRKFNAPIISTDNVRLYVDSDGYSHYVVESEIPNCCTITASASDRMTPALMIDLHQKMQAAADAMKVLMDLSEGFLGYWNDLWGFDLKLLEYRIARCEAHGIIKDGVVC